MSSLRNSTVVETNMNLNWLVSASALLALLSLGTSSAHAIFHLWDVAEVFSNTDGSVQFIELVNPTSTSGETGATTAHLHSASGNKTYFFPNNLVGSSANKRLLIATAGFGSLPGGVAPDFPTLPLPANFFNPAGDTISIIVNCCGTVDSKTFGPVPTNGVLSLHFPPAGGSQLTNSPTNYAGATGSVNLTPPITPTGDYNDDGTVNAADYTVWRDTLGQAAAPNGSAADGDADGTIDDGDYTFWTNNFGDVVPGAGGASLAVVPEPMLIPLAIQGLAGVVMATSRCRRSPESCSVAVHS
jgi:hypothetical protein